VRLSVVLPVALNQNCSSFPQSIQANAWIVLSGRWKQASSISLEAFHSWWISHNIQHYIIYETEKVSLNNLVIYQLCNELHDIFRSDFGGVVKLKKFRWSEYLSPDEGNMKRTWGNFSDSANMEPWYGAGRIFKVNVREIRCEEVRWVELTRDFIQQRGSASDAFKLSCSNTKD